MFNIKYYKCSNMSKTNYIEMIEYLLNNLKKLHDGNILISFLLDKNIIITNYNYYTKRLANYPIAQTELNTIVIPSVFKPDLHYVLKKHIINNFSELVPINSLITIDKKYICKMIPPLIITLAHELIHMAHYYIDNNSINYSTCEDSVIFGRYTPKKSLLLIPYNNLEYLITENSIRKELDLPVRISHDSVEIDYNFSKTNFYKDLYRELIFYY